MTSRVMLIASTFLLLLTLLPTAYSQLPASVPFPVEQFAFTRAGPKAYMIGGKFVENGTTKAVYGQVYSLDLTVAWKTASPPWQALAQVPPVYFINAVAAPDNQSIIVIKRGANDSLSFPTYRIANNAWDANPVNTGPVQESRQGIKPVMDPLTWNIYINAWTYLDVFNTKSATFQYLNMPAYTFTSRFFAGSCYNAARRSIMYFGGLNGSIQFDPAATYVSEYSISTSLWSNFVREPCLSILTFFFFPTPALPPFSILGMQLKRFVLTHTDFYLFIRGMYNRQHQEHLRNQGQISVWRPARMGTELSSLEDALHPTPPSAHLRTLQEPSTSSTPSPGNGQRGLIVL